MKQTLPIIQNILKAYVEKLFEIDVETDDEFYALVNKAKSELSADLEATRSQNPDLLYLNYDKKMSSASAKEIVNQIAKKASKHYAPETLPTTEYFVDNIQGESVVTPSFITKWETYTEMELPAGDSAKDMLASFLLNVIMSLPIKKVNFTVVDLGNSFLADFLYKNIDGSLYHDKPISDVESYKMFLQSMNERVLSCVKQYGNLIDYNKEHKTIAEPYEIIVLFDEDKRFFKDKDGHILEPECLKELDALKKNGEKAGIHIINFKRGGQEIPKKTLIGITPITTIPALQDAVVKYINDEAQKEEQLSAITLNIDEYNHSYQAMNDTIRIQVGRNGRTPVDFKMDTISHVHAFILGQSGSGKSVFLHNVISGAMLKYAPEELELYLLDFKLGGVEFNRYKGEKHVHAMLVDNSDPQITLEILRELRERMEERGKLLRTAGVNNIKEYNKQHSDEKMKHILFIADECHEMFAIDEDNRLVGNEISEIVTKIAKEGRNQGVHLLLATQTLANTEIGSEILNNISDHYLLKCSIADSERMVNNSSKVTAKLTTGMVYYHHVEENYTFQAYYADKQLATQMMQMIQEKTNASESNEKFYFSGASIFQFEPSVMEDAKYARKCRRMPVAFLGKSIDIDQSDVAIPLSEDFSENVLLIGLNDDSQATRTTMNMLVSLLASSKARESDTEFAVIDCLTDEDKYVELLDEMEDAELVKVIQPKKRASFFKQLAEDILSDKAKETILLILGQDRFRELKLDMELEEETNDKEDVGLTSMISFGSDMSRSKNSVRSFSEAMNVILDKGPEVGVHTIIQLEKSANYLFTDYISHKEMFKKFKHLILLKSDENAATQLHLRNDIRLENLSKDEERLRAYYYAEESDTYTLFTPYMPLKGKEFKQFIKKL